MLKNCPHCRSDKVFINVNTIRKEDGKDYMTNYHVSCHICRLAGPSFCNNMILAIDTWNKLSYEHN